MGTGAAGFSVLELVVVVAIVLTVAAIALPSVSTMMDNFKLRNATADCSGIVQQARSRAVQDSRFYSVYVTSNTSTSRAFVNIYPQNNDGTSGSSQGTVVDPKDPIVTWGPEIAVQPQGSAPSATALRNSFLPTTSSVVPLDGSVSGNPITFGPMGVPCVPVAATGGTVCNNSSGPVAYWLFLQDSRSQAWQAITITPAGRIQKWALSGVTWSPV